MEEQSNEGKNPLSFVILRFAQNDKGKFVRNLLGMVLNLGTVAPLVRAELNRVKSNAMHANFSAGA